MNQSSSLAHIAESDRLDAKGEGCRVIRIKSSPRWLLLRIIFRMMIFMMQMLRIASNGDLLSSMMVSGVLSFECAFPEELAYTYICCLRPPPQTRPTSYPISACSDALNPAASLCGAARPRCTIAIFRHFHRGVLTVSLARRRSRSACLPPAHHASPVSSKKEIWIWHLISCNLAGRSAIALPVRFRRLQGRCGPCKGRQGGAAGT